MMVSKSLSRIVNGEIKHARQQELRDRRNPLGLNRKGVRVIREIPERLAAQAVETRDELEHVSRRWKRKLLRLYLRESAKSERSLMLVKRVLLKGKKPQNESYLLSILFSAARSIIARCKKALGIPGRKGNQNQRGQR